MERSRVKTDWSPWKDVDVDRAGARIQQDDRLARLDAVVDLEGVLQGEGIDVNDDGRAASLCDHPGVISDLLLLGRHQEDVHRVAAAAGVAPVHDLIVEVDVLDVERDVLLGFPVDRLGELRVGHHRQRDLLDDDGVAGQ
jgi:hypothetical protein